MCAKSRSWTWRFALAGPIVAFITGCGLTTPPVSPTPLSLNPTSSILHYIPPNGSHVHLEFDYPSSWILDERLGSTDFAVIYLTDSRQLTVPTRAPGEPHGTSSDFGEVRIIIKLLATNETLETFVEEYRQAHSEVSWIAILNLFSANIAGKDAMAFEYQIQPLAENGYSSLMFERDTFFVIEDHVYQIAFSVAARERGGAFEKEYEQFYSSLKILP